MSRYYTFFDSPLGRLLLLADENTLTGVYIDGQKYCPTLDVNWQQQPQLAVFQMANTQLLEYINGDRHAFTVPYRFAAGTAFQQKVWQTLATVPYGTTLSYGELAKQAGVPASVRAVAAAVGRNPLLMIIPCQRIIGSTGKLTGFAAGLPRKHMLLELERIKKPTL